MSDTGLNDAAGGKARTNMIKATGAVLAVNLVVKILGFVRETFIADAFGATRYTDAYIQAYTVPYFLQAVLGAALVTAIVPALTRFNDPASKTAKDEADRVTAMIINTCAIILLGLTAAGALSSAPLIRALSPGFDSETLALATRLSLIMFPLVFFMGLSSVFTGVLNARYRFVAGASAPGVSNLIIILSAALLNSYGIEWLAAGTLISFVFSALMLVAALKRSGYRHTFAVSFSNPAVKGVLAGIIPIALGVAVNQICFAINRIFASGLDEGSISALNYANKLMNLPVGVFAAAVAAVIYPLLAQRKENGDLDRDSIARTANRGMILTSLVAIPATAGLIILARPTVRLLFERGAFDSEATSITAFALIFFSAGILPLALNMILTRVFYAAGDIKTPIIMGGIAVLSNIAFSFLLLAPLSHGGLALANSLSTLLNTVLLYAVLCRRRLISPLSYLTECAKMILAAVVMTAGIWFLSRLLAPDTGDSLGLLIQVAVSVIVGAALFFVSAGLFGVREVRTLALRTAQKLKK